MLFLFGFLFCLSVYPNKHEDFKKTATGLRYKIYKNSKDSAKPGLGDWVSLEMRYTTIVKGKDTLLFDSKSQLKGVPVKFQLPPSDFKGDLYEGIGMMSAGDSAIFVIPADSLFLKTFKMPKRPEVIDSNSTVDFYVSLLSFDNPAKLKKNEEDALQKYIADNKIQATPSKTGIYMIENQKGEGMKIDTGCQVNLHFKVALIGGKELFSSYTRPEPVKFQYGTRFDTPGIEEAIGKMLKGGKAKVIVPSKMGFGEAGRGVAVPPYSTLVYEVEILDVLSKAQCEKEKAEAAQQAKPNEPKNNVNAKKDEPMLIEKYITDKKITVKPTASGLYYIEKAKGTGPQAVAGKKVKVHYTGTLLDGTKFDSSVDRNEPFGFTLGNGEVIRGWDEGIALMKQGGTATLIIPSSIAYGDRSMGPIAAYSTLVFDVELIEVK